MEEKHLIRISNADIRNGSGVILHNVELTVDKGEFIYLVGKVGSGKSSLIRTLICEFPFENGEIEICGYNLGKIRRKDIPYLRRQIGVVFQDFQLLMDRTVEENLMFVLGATGWKEKKLMKERVNEVLTMVGMEGKSANMPHQLSGGEKQRVVIARALLNNPPVILADEPTGNLDPDTTNEIMQLLMKIHQQRQPAVIMVTHNTEITSRYPHQLYICEQGKLKAVENPHTIELDDSILEEIF
ncbi:MAG: ATP-binding cassette domain-containing protein [Bacteroidales bacterium]|nr:ATP-binding cassette domain-containing protein [Candidatus Egerieousia equi]